MGEEMQAGKTLKEKEANFENLIQVLSNLIEIPLSNISAKDIVYKHDYLSVKQLLDLIYELIVLLAKSNEEEEEEEEENNQSEQNVVQNSEVEESRSEIEAQLSLPNYQLEESDAGDVSKSIKLTCNEELLGKRCVQVRPHDSAGGDGRGGAKRKRTFKEP